MELARANTIDRIIPDVVIFEVCKEVSCSFKDPKNMKRIRSGGEMAIPYFR